MSDLEVFPISLPGGINQSAPVPSEQDLEELENFALFRNRVGFRAPLQLVATLQDDQGTPADVEAILDIIDHAGKLWAASWSGITDKVYLHSMQVDGTSVTLEAVLWTAVTNKPVIKLLSVEGGTAASPQSRVYAADYNQNLQTKYWDGSSVQSLAVDFNADSTAEAVYFSLMFNFKFHVWATGFYEGTTQRGDMARFSQPGLIPDTDPAGGTNPREWFTADHRSVGRRGDKIVAGAPVGDRLVLFQKRAMHSIYGSGAGNWTRQQLSDVIGAVGPHAVAVVDEKIAYFWASDGPYRTDGVTVEYLGMPIRELVVTTDASEMDTRVGYSPDDGMVHFLVSPAGLDEYSLDLSFDTRRERWMKSRWYASDPRQIDASFVPGTPTGESSSRLFVREGRSFTSSVSPGRVDYATMRMRREGSPTGTIHMAIYDMQPIGSLSYPTGPALVSSEPIDVSTIATSQSDVAFEFDVEFIPLSSKLYAIVVDFSGITFQNETNDIRVQTQSGGSNTGVEHNGSNWQLTSNDRYFVLYGRNEAGASRVEFGALAFLDSAAAPGPAGAPSSPVATAFGSNAIAVSWTNGDTNIDTDTHIYRSTSSGFTPNDATNRVGVVAAGVTIFNDLGCVPTTTYYYKIKHFRNSQHSSESAQVSAFTWLLTPTNLGLAGLTNGLRITGSNPESDVTADVVIEYSLDGANWNSLTTITTGSSTFTYDHTGLICGLTYYYRAKATEAGYTDSAWSATVSRAACAASTAPTAPSGLTATAVGQTQINLSWTDNSNNEDTFEIYRSLDDVTYNLLETKTAGSTSHSDTGLTSNTTYYYKVRAVNSVGPSAFTTSSSDTTDPDLDAPTALVAVAVNASQINLTWADNAADETSYEIHQSDVGSGGPYSLVATIGADSTSDTRSGLSAATQYWYKVRAVNGTTQGSFSAVATATTTGVPPTAPSGLTATTNGGSPTDTIDLAWTDNSSDEEGFEIQRDSGGGFSTIHTTAAGVESYQDTGLNPGTTYTYRVRATHATNGASSWSNTDDATTDGSPAAPTAPSNLLATGDDADLNGSQVDAVDLTWDDNSNNEDDFVLERCEGASCTNWAVIATLPADTVSYRDTGVTAAPTANKTYRYRLKATNGTGDSAYTSIATATVEPKAGVPSVSAVDTSFCTGIVPTPQITVSWLQGDVTGLERRRLLRSVGGGPYQTRVEWTSSPESITNYQDSVSFGFTYKYKIEDYFGTTGENTGTFTSPESNQVIAFSPDCSP